MIIIDENSLSRINLGTAQHHTVTPITCRIQEQFINEAKSSQSPFVEVITISEEVNDAEGEIHILNEAFCMFDGTEIKQEPINDEISSNNLTTKRLWK